MADLNLDKTKCEEVRGLLLQLLGSTFALYLKTLGIHWNVKGANFRGVHTWTNEQYESLQGDVDAIGERIVQLGGYAPATFEEMGHLSQVMLAREFRDAGAMLRALVEDHALLVRLARKISQVAANASDGGTTSLMDSFIQSHEKLIWMLSKSIE
ncbi:MAG: DNA starvation/stationary phase protection protein [Puniceicoccales bacterium]|jgi:starvation-inducible DNA-binding protein|nr:DNA starvation/stationary phase protection protein [Puniceicoccales bacterium]